MAKKKKSKARSVSKSIRRRYVVSGKIMVISAYRAKELREKGKKVHLAKSQSAPSKKKPAKKKPAKRAAKKAPKRKTPRAKRKNNPKKKTPRKSKGKKSTAIRPYVVSGKTRRITARRADELRAAGKKVRLAKTQNPKGRSRASTRGKVGIGTLAVIGLGLAAVTGLLVATRKKA